MQVVAKKPEVLFGMKLGDPAIKGNEEGEGAELDELGTRMVEHGECVSEIVVPNPVLSQSYKPFYTTEEVRALRTFRLETGVIPALPTPHIPDSSQGVQLLGFKDHSELLFEDNIKHSTFIYPDEDVSQVIQKQRHIYQFKVFRHTLVAGVHLVHL